VSDQTKINNLVSVSVYLSLRSERLTVEQMSQRLGMLPDSFRSKGELNKVGEPFTETSWTIEMRGDLSETPDEFVTAMNDYVRALLQRIQARLDKFRQLATEGSATLLIGIVARNVPPLIIAGDVLEMLSSLKLADLEIDLIT
jgi:Domain of unknown function (DUF4279)